MKLLLIVTFTAIITHYSYAQSFEEKISIRSCEHIKKEKIEEDSAITRCISKSMLEIVMEDSTRQYIKNISTVEGVKNTVSKVRSLLAESCKEYMRKPKEINLKEQ